MTFAFQAISIVDPDKTAVEIENELLENIRTYSDSDPRARNMVEAVEAFRSEAKKIAKNTWPGANLGY